MKLEVPVNVDIDDVTKLIHDLQCLQTYKLGVNDTMLLVSLDDVADVFADHIRAKRLDKDINVHSKSALDHIHNVVRDDAYRRGYEQGKADANLPEIPDSWIPVSERLPNKYGEYFVSVKWFDGTYDVSVYEYTGYNEWNDGDMCGQTVTAWMPKLKPWEGE